MTIIKRLRIFQFRNFARRDFVFHPGINQIVGENGTGKTNLLEALCLFSTGRSFRTSQLLELVQKEKDSFQLEISYEKNGVEGVLHLSVKEGERKMKHNATEFTGFSNLLGLLPSVIYAPSDLKLIEDSPNFRRRFLNIHISQTDPVYPQQLLRYSKIILQRNALLKQNQSDAMDIWEGELAKSSLYIMQKRKQAIEELSSLMKERYSYLSQKKEEPSISYLPCIKGVPTADLWAKSRSKEMERGFTLIGPHRDDFAIQLFNEMAKGFASEGQKRTLIAALKLSENKRLEQPFLAIDDFCAHLDQFRKALLMNQVKTQGQVFITTPEKLDLPGHVIELK